MAVLLPEPMCPITHELLQDPVMCNQCGQSFSEAALQAHLQRNSRSRCPLCNTEGARFPRNRTLAETMQDGNIFEVTKQFVMVFAGPFGSGKSTQINLLVDSSGETTVTEEGSNARGCTTRVERVFRGEVDHNGTARLIALIDTPGFGDPEKSDGETLRQLSQATLEVSQGVDLFVHVVKKGRMNETDRNLPELLLTGLADDDETRREIASRYVFVVTHADSDRRPVTQSSIDQFKGEMKSFFPQILEPAVMRAIFVENGRNSGTSPYGDAVQNRNLILDRAIQTRKLYHSVFKSKPLQTIIQRGFENAMAKWNHMGLQLRQFNPEELGALLNFFKKVQQHKKFIAMTDATTSCAEFRHAWNNFSLAVRDQVAVKVAKDVISEVEESCHKSWTEKIKAMGQAAYEWRGTFGSVSGAAAGVAVGLAHACAVM